MLYWAGARPFYLFLLVAPVLSILSAFNVILFSIWAFIMAIVIFYARTKIISGVSYFLEIFFLVYLQANMGNVKPISAK